MPTFHDAYQLGRRFLLRRARPIEMARFRCLFEGASAETVLDVLAGYQNGDGGFAHALEADYWNPHSSPIQTWAAAEIVHSIEGMDAGHPIVMGILSYLDSGAHFDGHTWSRTIATNNDYPHAEWWKHSDLEDESAARSYNPTAALAGFALQFAEPDSPLHDLAKRIATEAFRTLLAADSVEDHELSCFLRLYQCVVEQKVELGISLLDVEDAIDRHANAAITRDTAKWSTEYVCRPSRFIRSRTDRLYSKNEDLVRYEVEFLLREQLEDGSWPVTWHWSSYPETWPIVQEWWKSIVVIENLQFIMGIDKAG